MCAKIIALVSTPKVRLQLNHNDGAKPSTTLPHRSKASPSDSHQVHP